MNSHFLLHNKTNILFCFKLELAVMSKILTARTSANLAFWFQLEVYASADWVNQ